MTTTTKRVSKLLSSLLVILAIGLISLHPNTSNADMSVSAYQNNIQDSSKLDMTLFYLEAVGTGITWTNTTYYLRSGTGLFCAPKDFRLKGNLARDLVNNILKDQRRYDIKDNDSISFVLLSALSVHYPCQ